MPDFVHINGTLTPAQTAAVSAYDHGLLYGHGLFETLPVYNSRVFRLAAHLKRLQCGAKLLGWPALPGDQCLTAAINQVLAANNVVNGALRLTVCRGRGPLAPDDAACGDPVVIIATRPVPSASQLKTQWTLSLSAIRRNETSPLSGVKSLNYLDNILARKAARSLGADEALLLNTGGFVAEGSVSNMFFVTGDAELVTPSPASGILPGVTREAVLELAAAENLKITERLITPEELPGFTEAFATNSLMGIMPVTAIDSRPLNSGPGPVTRLLQARYRELVEQETTS